MDVVIVEMPEVPPKTNPLLSEPKFPAQLMGSFLFCQIISGLSENPVKLLFHDRRTGQRKLITVTLDTEQPTIKYEMPVKEEPLIRKVVSPTAVPSIKPAPLIQRVDIPEKAPADPVVTRSPSVSPSPSGSPSVSRRQQTPPPRVSLSPSPAAGLKSPQAASATKVFEKTYAKEGETFDNTVARITNVMSPSIKSPSPLLKK